MKNTRKRSDRIERSSGNVFVDLGLSGAADRQTKVRLAVALNRAIDGSKLRQAEIAEKLGINQPKVSALLHYNLEGFSVERLMNFLMALGHDVDIVIRKARPRKLARIHVSAA
ncbi:MAG: XRE family transcriptional regulator [Acidobacteriales bacterium]|nr:XRE family transcriptional regulator [Terriglobales bacterium]